MKKFKVHVEHCFDYDIEIDEEALDSCAKGDFIGAFRQHFGDFSTWDDHAEYIAEKTSEGFTFIEGYGAPYHRGSKQFSCEEKESNKYINVIPVSDYVDVYSEEI